MSFTTTLNFLKKYAVLLAALISLSLLLFKNPYEPRNLIANLEPFPDAFHYTTPPRCLLEGQEWNMCRLFDPTIEGIEPAVPPAYSLFFIPAYLLNMDVRTFYFANIFLSLSSVVLLFFVSQNFFKNTFTTGFILFAYTTNYFTYWLPTLAMAENLLIPLFLLSILLLQQKKVTKKISVLAGITAAGFYATKYAFAPLTLIFPLLYIFNIVTYKHSKQDRFLHLGMTLIPFGLLLLNVVGFDQLKLVFTQLFSHWGTSTQTAQLEANTFFSLTYFSNHFPKYADALFGNPQRFLWDYTPLVTKWLALPGLLGLAIALKKSSQKISIIWLCLAGIAQLLFIATFYVVDIRYVYHLLPIVLLGFGFFLTHLQKSFFTQTGQSSHTNAYAICIVVLAVIYFATNASRLKSVVVINLKYSETPWWYLSQLEMNSFFSTLPQHNQKPILITLAAPFLTDNYSNQTYTTLPLNSQQDFHGSFAQVWGDNDYSDLLALYTDLLKNEQELYITNYGVHAADHFKDSYQNITNTFTLTQVHSGCHTLCSIYKLEL